MASSLHLNVSSFAGNLQRPPFHRRSILPPPVRSSGERQALFNRIAPVYDNLNDVLSLGQHRIWKRMAVNWSGAKEGDTLLDLCCGSGDLAFLLSEKAGPSGKAMKEMHRVLKPGSKVSVLDFNKSTDPLNALIQVKELKRQMQSSGMPWPGDEGQQRWEQAMMAIKKVWASKWNERAYFSTRKVKLDHDCLCMAVLVQEIINADYAFVIHTTNPSSGDSSEIYAEVVNGLGETLVGAYPGRALSFICKKNDLNSPKLLGYPSKPIGLFIRRSIIFRSDSNGEDLEGYAGAGLYDSVPMDEEEKVVLDYSDDPIIKDSNFQQSILSSIACAGHTIEELYGSDQDIEGVVKDGKIYVVQTRPQM